MKTGQPAAAVEVPQKPKSALAHQSNAEMMIDLGCMMLICIIVMHLRLRKDYLPKKRRAR